MRTTIGLLLCILAAALAGLALRAAEPAPAAGKVLLLDNDRVLEGDIERVGDQYRVRRPLGEAWVPANKALCLCATLADAYACLRRRANLNDPDERLRLARWCHLHGLRTEALAEVTAAVDLRPDHAETRRLLSSLQHAAAPTSAARAKPDARPAPDLPPPDLSAESLCAFRSRVQPVLMNACASCHATGHGGAFQLTRIYEDGGSNRKLVQRNLAAVLAQVNPRAPAGSPLLTKAVSAHDGKMAQAPLKGRQAPAFRVLEDWVQQTLANNPQLQELAAAAPPPEPKAPPEPAPKEPAAFHAENPAAPETAPPKSPATGSVLPRLEPTSAAAPPPAAPADPFDPVIFNRQMHPEHGSAGK
jgi:hypothetical protein